LLLYFWAALLAIVVVGELLPGHSKPVAYLSDLRLSDGVLHFSTYAILAIIPTTALPAATTAVCLITTEITGIALEIGQTFVPGRSGDVHDVWANTMGVLIGTAIALIFRSRFRSYAKLLSLRAGTRSQSAEVRDSGANKNRRQRRQDRHLEIDETGPAAPDRTLLPMRPRKQSRDT
jgi:hypothetical protein